MELVRGVLGGGAFSDADHIQTLSEERRDGKKDRGAAYKSKFKGLVSDLTGTDKCLLLREKSTGAWPSVRDTIVSRTLLSATEVLGF